MSATFDRLNPVTGEVTTTAKAFGPSEAMASKADQFVDAMMGEIDSIQE